MNLKPEQISVRKFFAADDQHIVPDYQRKYSWSEEHVDALFYDIESLGSKDYHMLGIILCLSHKLQAGARKNQEFDLVDGQQRITTLSLFLKAMQTRYKNLKGSNNKARSIQKYLISKSGKKPLLKLGKLDNDIYKDIILNDDHDSERTSIEKSYKIIKEHIESFNVRQLDSFCKNFMDKVKLIILNVNDMGHAFKIFENINNRGLQLNQTDIIKNFMLAHVSILNNNAARQTVLKQWGNLVADLDKKDSDLFFQHYISSELGQKIPKNDISNIFIQYYGSRVENSEAFVSKYFRRNLHQHLIHIQKKPKKNVTKFSEDLSNDAKLYSQIIKQTVLNGHEEVNSHLANLDSIDAKPARIFLLRMFKKKLSPRRYIELIELLETFMVRWHICGEHTGMLDSIFSGLNIDDAKSTLKKKLPSDTKFCNRFKDYEKFSGRRAKYILRELEYHITDNKSKEYTINKGQKVHLEHILPKNIESPPKLRRHWHGYLGDDVGMHGKFVSRIGNLTLLNRALNITASNNTFDFKKEKYKKSDFRLTKDLIRYNRFDFKKVNSRSEKLAKLAVDRWKF